jgi:ureidoacrylate peracid hydrolase
MADIGTTSAGLDTSDSPATSIVLPARPEAIRLDTRKTALIVVDMQNAYASTGGYLDIAGFDISGAAPATEKIATAVAAARRAGIPVIFLQNGWDADYAEAGGPGSPNWHKSNALKTMRKQPDLQGRLLAKGGWDYAIVDALTPEPGDIVIPKTRYSVFFNTNMDSFLRARGIRNLVFVGIATNVCVEGIVLEDATHAAGPDFAQKAAIYNIEAFFGWVSTVADFSGAILQTVT